MSFKESLIENCKMFDVKLDDEEADMFFKYMNLLLEWNEKVNLTAITEENEIILKHFVDSLTVCKYINTEDKVIDVGTGAGFPGIPLKIVNEKLNITLMDSLNKRIKFLDEVIDNLKLKNIETVHARAEELGQNKEYREKYDVAVSRAVANMATLSEYLLPFVKPGGKCIFMKGSDIEEELNSSKKAIKVLGGEIEKVDKFVLPNSDYERNIIIVRKIKNTENKYPRKAGIPSKLPIK